MFHSSLIVLKEQYATAAITVTLKVSVPTVKSFLET